MTDFSFVKNNEFADAIRDADDDHKLTEALRWLIDSGTLREFITCNATIVPGDLFCRHELADWAVEKGWTHD